MLFYDVILPIDHASLTLDGVTSFLRVLNVGKHVNAFVTVKPLAGFLQCNCGKLEESEGYNCFFIVSCVLEALVRELLSNKGCVSNLMVYMIYLQGCQ